jgi:hypothetical protein
MMKGKGGHGRGTSGKRGIGSGSSSHKTSSSKPAKLDGFPKTDGTKGGMGKGSKK